MCRPLKVDMVAIGMVRHPDHVLMPITDDPDRAGIGPAGSDGPAVPVLVGIVKGGIARVCPHLGRRPGPLPGHAGYGSQRVALGRVVALRVVVRVRPAPCHPVVCWCWGGCEGILRCVPAVSSVSACVVIVWVSVHRIVLLFVSGGIQSGLL